MEFPKLDKQFMTLTYFIITSNLRDDLFEGLLLNTTSVIFKLLLNYEHFPKRFREQFSSTTQDEAKGLLFF